MLFSFAGVYPKAILIAVSLKKVYAVPSSNVYIAISAPPDS
jgi:hypothetical protein